MFMSAKSNSTGRAMQLSTFISSLGANLRAQNGLAWTREFWRARASANPVVRVGARVGWRSLVVEWAILLFGVLFFCQRILDFGKQTILFGPDTESLSQLDWVLYNAVVQAGQFPLWNPYFRTGWPFFADGFSHVYNPLVTIPVLLFGVFDGPKLAVLLSYLAAALGMWWLGKVLGVNAVCRVWMGLMYAFAGQAAARSIQGQYDFVYGYAWLPWALGALIAVAETRRRFYVSLGAIFFALILFSGNGYYAFYAIFVALLFSILAVVSFARKPFSPRIDTHIARVLFVTGVLALGLSAIQLVPLLESRALITKGEDRDLTTAHTFSQVWNDYTSPDPRRPDTESFPQAEEYYAYIGLVPFVLLPLVVFAFWRGRRRGTLAFALLFLGATMYAALKDMPFGMAYASNSFLTQWRYPTRALIFGELALIVLVGLGVDAFWKWALARPMLRAPSWRARIIPFLSRLMLGIWIALLGLGVLDVYSANRFPLGTHDSCDPQYEAMAWLRAREANSVFVSNPQGCHGALISQGFHYLDGFYGYSLNPIEKGDLGQRPIQVDAKYYLIGNGIELPFPDLVLVQQFETNAIYRKKDALPFAFAVNAKILTNDQTKNPLPARAVRPLMAYPSGPNRFEFIANGASDAILVVLNNLYPGWKVYVDGRSSTILNVGGFMATRLLGGIHKYEFVFDPLSFKVGLLISLVSLALVAGMILTDLRVTLPRVAIPQARRGALRGVIPSLTLEREAANNLRIGRLNLARLNLHLKWRGRAVEGAAILPWVLFGGALIVYAITRLVALDRFPIYFFADEALQTVLARELIANGFKSKGGDWFPVFFDAYGFQNPVDSVYVQAIAIWLFGVSVTVSRAGPAVVTLLASAVVALMLKLVYKIRYWWTGVLFLGIVPAWFLHSRTVFETAMMTSFYAACLLCYLLYRYRSPRYLFGAIVFGALTFYSYGNGQIVMGITAIALALSDFRYHLKQWRMVGLGLVLAVVLAIPYLQLRATHPAEAAYHLRMLDTYLFQKIPLEEKITQFLSKYSYGLSPAYWFIPNEQDLARHRLKDYGNILLWTLPLFVVGVGLALWRIRESRYRLMVIAALAAPVGGALTDIGITRVMAFVVPTVVLTAIGLDWLLGRIKISLVKRIAPVVVFGVLSFASLAMLNDALTNGPLWFRDYGLYGMQWGAEQLFESIPTYLKQSPNTQVLMTSTWANGADVFVKYFMPDEERVTTNSISAFMDEKKPLTHDMVFITTPNELKDARESGKFKPFHVEQVIKYPDGSDGFLFVRLEYVDNVDEMFAEEKLARQKPVVDQVTWNGETVTVTHSLFDMGRVINFLDDDTYTLARGLEANPVLIEFEFASPRPIKGLALDMGSDDYAVDAVLFGNDNADPVTYHQEFVGLPPDPHFEMDFSNPPALVSRIRLLIKSLKQGDPAHVHVREVKFK